METNRILLILLAVLGLNGCVSVRSNREPSANLSAFDNVLVVLKQKDYAQREASKYTFAFPPGYKVTALGLDDLTFGNQDSLVRVKAYQVGANAILWLENRPTGTVTGNQYGTSSDFELYGELRTMPTNLPTWKIKVLPPRGDLPYRVVSQMLRDGVLQKSGPIMAQAPHSLQTP